MKRSPLGSMRGSALIISLWATAFLASLGIAQAARVALESKWVGRLQEEQQAWYLALSSIEVANAVLSQDDPQWDAPTESWGKIPTQALAFGWGTLHYLIQDEQSWIPLNSPTTDEAILNRLPGFTPEATQALLARRAEGKPIQHLAELIPLPNFQKELLPDLEPWVSVLSNGPVNLNTASGAALTAIGLSQELADKILQYRDRPGVGADETPGTSDDGVFVRPDIGEIQAILERDSGPISDSEEWVKLGNLINQQLLGVNSRTFRIAVEGVDSRHGIRRRAVAVIQRGTPGRSAQILSWHEPD